MNNDTTLHTVMHRVKPKPTPVVESLAPPLIGLDAYAGKTLFGWCYSLDRKSMLLVFDVGSVKICSACIDDYGEQYEMGHFRVDPDFVDFHRDDLVRLGVKTQAQADEYVQRNATTDKYYARRDLINILAASDPLTPDELILIDAMRRNAGK